MTNKHNSRPDSVGKDVIGVLTIPIVGERGSATVSCGVETGIGVRSIPTLGDRGSSSAGKKCLGTDDDTGGVEVIPDSSLPPSSNPNSRLLTKLPMLTAAGITNIYNM